MAARVVLAMSGGVDSSVAALLLKKQGYEVIGLFMRTGVVAEETKGQRKDHKKGCCSSLDARDARQVADLLDIPFYALDFTDDFRRIMDYFTDEYLQGRTPNPCVMCNNWLKFGKLWTYGKQLDADFIATGHYAQIGTAPSGPELRRAADPAKDQTYVLFGLRKQLLPKLLFPIGGFPKEEIRAIARREGLPVFAKPDSQEICFVPSGHHADFVRQQRPGLVRSGTIVNQQGEMLGTHDGIDQFTVGQRKGLRVAAESRRYVLQILPQEGIVVVGPREACLSPGLLAERSNWLIDTPIQSLACTAKIAYRSHPVPATVHVLPDQHVEVHFAEPQLGIAPGQAAVFYDGDRVLGGGWIARAL
jgi:tRNA-uridine 2-sulfurtransferase